MAALTVSLEQYLHGDFEPDVDFVDGLLQERFVGEYNHSSWQEALLAWCRTHANDWHTRAKPELRLQVSPTRYRVPDVAILDRDQVPEQVPTHPPLVVLEILSPEDRLKRLLVKLEDYRRMGVADVLVVDPEDGTFYRYIDGGLDVVGEDVVRLQSGRITLDRRAIEQLLD